MAEYQVELGVKFTSETEGSILRDVDILESFGREMEAIAGEMGPATALNQGNYVALLTVDADTPFEAGQHGAEVVTEALTRALAEHGREFDGPLFERLHVDRTDELAAV